MADDTTPPAGDAGTPDTPGTPPAGAHVGGSVDNPGTAAAVGDRFLDLCRMNRDVIRTGMRLVKRHADAAKKANELLEVDTSELEELSAIAEAIINEGKDQREMLLEGTPMGDALTASTLKHGDGHSLEAGPLGDVLRSVEIAADDSVISAWTLPVRVEVYEYAKKRGEAIAKKRDLPKRPSAIPLAWLSEPERVFATGTATESDAPPPASGKKGKGGKGKKSEADVIPMPAQPAAPEIPAETSTPPASEPAAPDAPAAPASPEPAPSKPAEPAPGDAPASTSSTAASPVDPWRVQPYVTDAGPTDEYELVRIEIVDGAEVVAETFPRLFSDKGLADAKAEKFNATRREQR